MNRQSMTRRDLLVGFVFANLIVGFHWQSQPNLFLLLSLGYAMHRGLKARLFIPWFLGFWQSGLTESLFGYLSLCYLFSTFLVLLYHERIQMYHLWHQCALISCVALLMAWGLQGQMNAPIICSALMSGLSWWLYDDIRHRLRLRMKRDELIL